MPKEITRHRDLLDAISGIGALRALTAERDGHYEYELDLEVVVYGRNYHGKQVGPYVRLLEYAPGEEIVRAGDWGGNEFYFVVAGRAEVLIAAGDDGAAGVAGVAGTTDRPVVRELGAGMQFGEMSVLAGNRRAATVRAPAGAPVTVLEVRRPALRLLRKLPGFSESLDSAYRHYGLSATVNDVGVSVPLSPELQARLEKISRFRVLARGHVLFRAGDPVKSLYLLRSGWVRLTSVSGVPGEGGAEEAPFFVGRGSCLGTEGIMQDSFWDRQGSLPGRTELLEIPIARLRQLPDLREALRSAFGGEQRQPEPLPVARAQEALIETGLADGNNLLVMDMDLCVRCGNCSLACHQMHGHSRLQRRGISIERPRSLTQVARQSLLAPSVCLHCQDPECLTGCPTGAISRQQDGQVDIDPQSCIGCADCATQCPYNAISMTPRRSSDGPLDPGLFNLFSTTLPPAVEQTEDLVAVKCNLCSGTPLNPPGVAKRAYSCEENCPTGALRRVEPRHYFEELQRLEGRVARDGNRVIVHGSTPPAGDKREVRLTHLIGLALTLLTTALIGQGIWRSGLDASPGSGWLDWRWITGLIGLGGIAGVMAYPVRRRIYTKRRGPLRYWLLAHSYLGVIGGIALLLHGGVRSGGLLTTALMITFDLVILTGLLGILLYVVVPRLLTRIEEQPLLLEDLLARRDELSAQIAADLAGSSPELPANGVRLILGPLRWLSDLPGILRRRESLEQSIVREEHLHLAMVSAGDGASRQAFQRLIRSAVTLRRVDALIALHRALRLWLAPHVIFTSIMLALMVIHILQVIYFETR